MLIERSNINIKITVRFHYLNQHNDSDGQFSHHDSTAPNNIIFLELLIFTVELHTYPNDQLSQCLSALLTRKAIRDSQFLHDYAFIALTI